MRPEPKVKKNGRCCVCGGERQVPKGSWARAAAKDDPFCSVECCRVYFQTSLPETMQQRAAKTRDGGT